MEPFELGRPAAHVEDEGKAAEDHLRLGQQPVALLARAIAVRVGPEVASRSEGRPRLPDLPVEPPARVRQPDRRIDGLDPRAIRALVRCMARTLMVRMGAPLLGAPTAGSA